MIIKIKSRLSCPFDCIISNFDIALFNALKPPLVPLKVIRFDGCLKGDEVHLELGFGKTWKSVIVDNSKTDNQWCFIDEGFALPTPLKFWRHIHKVEKLSDSESLILDHIVFKSSSKLLDILIYPLLFIQFKIRTPLYKKFFKTIHA
ncbi:MAG: hypothetical protein H6627_04320 [Calditrichae bacterium]|nr:hypothetical protein [Calditrichota bacterium]MCB9057766.1 hypothetical protein [Calditrichia bacterium]